MRILYCANDPVPFPKGAGVRIEATVTALLKAGAQVRLLTPQVPKLPGFDETLTGVDHHRIEVGSGNAAFLDRAMRFRRGVEQHLKDQWDVVWFRSPWEGWAARDFNGALVFEAHGFPSLELPHHFPQLYQHADFLNRLAWEEQILLQKARLVLTVSETGRRFLITRGVANEKIVLIPNSVPQEAFLQISPSPPQPLKAIYTGTLAPWQGLEQLLEALLPLKHRIALELSIVGTRKSSWARAIRQLSQQLHVRSALKFIGPFTSDELRRHLSDAHIAIAPLPADGRNTLQGCCPVKIIEFMAAGLPILSTRLPVVQELLEHDVSAWLVRPNSPWALAQGLLHLAQDTHLRARLGQAAQQRALRSFNRATFEQRLAAAIRRL